MEPKPLEHAFNMGRKFEIKKMATRRVVTKNYREHHVLSHNIIQLTRLMPQQMDKISAKGLCFNCDKKYIKGHKCDERKLLHIDFEEEEKYWEIESLHNLEKEEATPTISCHALVGINTLQTLKV